MYYKLHQTETELILAVADKDVLGKKYESNKRMLDLISFSSFYKGEIANKEQIQKMLLECTSANLVGKRACSIALSTGLAKSQDIVDIGGLSHIQLYRIRESTNSRI